MRQRQAHEVTANQPELILKDPSSTNKLLALVASRTHWAANCFRMAAFAIMLGAILFDGLNPWAQALNILAIIAFLYAATYVDEAAGMVYKIINREQQLEHVSGVITSMSSRSPRGPSKDAHTELDEAWSKIHGIKRQPGMRLSEAVHMVILERDRAWEALSEMENAHIKATPVRHAPALKVVSAQA